VPVWVAPLVAPAVDLSILGLLLGSRHLALAGATPIQLQPARRLLLFASLVTLALNVADPIARASTARRRSTQWAHCCLSVGPRSPRPAEGLVFYLPSEHSDTRRSGSRRDRLRY
jgi:hypothetical protein